MTQIVVSDRLCFEMGEGENTFIFFHGWAGNHTVWDFLVPELAKNNLCVTVDLFNHYEGTPCDEVHGENFGAFYSEKITEIINHYSGSDVLPVFWSLSSLLFLETVQSEKKLPIKEAVFLSATAKFCDEKGKEGFRPVALKKFRRELKRKYPDSVEDLFGKYFIASDSPSHLGEYRGYPHLQNLLDQLDYLERTDLLHVLKNISIPITVIHGENDQVIPCEMGKLLAEKIQHSSLDIIKKGSHSLMLDVPQKLLSFFNRFR